MTRIALTSVAFDAGTQIRAAIDPQVVTDYAEAMTNGATFPPIVLFHDGNQHYLADGFHRFMAAQRLAFKDIDADVQPGTKEDALWFALGANRTNGKRLSDADKRHAIMLALQQWGSEGGKSVKEISEQVGAALSYVQRVEADLTSRGNLPARTRVTGRDGKSYPAAYAERTKTTEQPDRSPAAVTKRREQIRDMAAEGYSSYQIAARLELSEEGCRKIARDIGVVLVADKALSRSHRHDSTRIVEHIVMDAENLTADVNLIDFASLDRDQLGAWADSLIASKKALDAFIKRLMKEQQKHGEAA